MIHYSPGHTSPNAANKANKSATVTMPSPVMSSGHAFASSVPRHNWRSDHRRSEERTLCVMWAAAHNTMSGMSNAHNRIPQVACSFQSPFRYEFVGIGSPSGHTSFNCMSPANKITSQWTSGAQQINRKRHKTMPSSGNVFWPPCRSAGVDRFQRARAGAIGGRQGQGTKHRSNPIR